MQLWVVALAAPVALVVQWLRWKNAAINERAAAAERALAAGDLERAASLFEAIVAGGGRWATIELARVLALRGEIGRAEQAAHQARGEARFARGVSRKAAEAQLLLVDVLIRCRRGELADARALLLGEWARFETAEGAGGWRAEACLVRGFLDAASGDSVEVWLGLDDTTRARVRWMASEWPDLRAFLDAHE
ncbi:MAG TPA: hypothetical protein VGL86_25750 [Polyangia bacterium]|jgi:hypothetical protein